MTILQTAIRPEASSIDVSEKDLKQNADTNC